MQEQKTKISIIIPVYNSIDYLEQSLERVINQTYSNLEIILVDDGSTDGSDRLCDAFSAKDDRISVIHKTNEGAARSRNAGFEKSTGGYVVFLDSDDIFELNMIETAYENIIRNNAEVCVWSYRTYDLNSSDISNHSIGNRLVMHDELNVDELRLASWAPWNKMISRELIEAKNIRFQDIPNANDAFFANAVILEASRIVFINDCLITYVEGKKGSITEKRILEKDYTIFAVEKIIKYLNEMNINPEDKWRFTNYLIDILARMFLDGNMSENCKTRFIEDWNKSDIMNIVSADRLSTHIKKFVDGIGKEINSKDEYFYYELYSDILSKMQKDNSKTVLWGFGRLGKIFVDYIDNTNFKLDYIVDVDSKKHGICYKGYEVCNPARVLTDEPAIIVLNSLYVNNVYEYTGSTKIYNLEMH